ncbi:MAE_28990/MAE_18760 family HEPN-like nuclease [Pararhodospirillum photometricum]|uniref:MAE_28990/MAE_18760 family HEPN-like nuclease n=1 Tax=Pararhodospirillum photometricum TaxID=1084 RepID=UPI0012FEB91E|nr:MAE_28990/MAE_18760 family HEPN-like nuclease [Pararhodospirillum photometricum]
MLDYMTSDLDWREAELGSLKILLARQDLTDQQKAVLLRASWALLYAHYEGFTKTAFTVFYEKVTERTQNCRSLPRATKVFALDKMLREIKKLDLPDFLDKIENFFPSEKPAFPEVDTKSNLWPNILEQLLYEADVKLQTIDQHRVTIKSLVARRNNIAHGKQEIITELSLYRSHELAVYEVMYDLAFSLDERIKRPPYSIDPWDHCHDPIDMI